MGGVDLADQANKADSAMLPRQSLFCGSPALLCLPQGKGEQTTFWLKGKEGFTIPLPEFTEEEPKGPEIL